MTTTNAQFSGKRQVLIFGDPQSRQVKEQLALLQNDSAGVDERDMQLTLAAQNTQGYRKYKVAPTAPFTLILVGKDGGEKYRSEKPVTAQELFTIIDAMPMRQAEMRRGRNKE